MRIGTVIPTRDPSPQLLGETIRSVEEQERPSDLRVLVDDGSMHPVQAPSGWELVRTEGLGISGARNAGLARLVGVDVVHILDHDDLVKPRFYARMLVALADADVAFAECAFLASDGSDIGTRLTDEIPDVGRITAALYRRNMIASSAAVFRRALWQRRPFRDYRYVQDWDFWLRAARSGATFTFVPDVLAGHRLHGGQVTAGGSPAVRLAETMRMLSRQRPSRYQAPAVARTALHLARVMRASPCRQGVRAGGG